MVTTRATAVLSGTFVLNAPIPLDEIEQRYIAWVSARFDGVVPD